MGPRGGRLLGPPEAGEECEAGADSLGTSGDGEQARGGREGCGVLLRGKKAGLSGLASGDGDRSGWLACPPS